MLYVRIIDLIRQLNFVIIMNNYYLRIKTEKELMVLSLQYGVNYAHYGTYYLTQVGSLDSAHPGAHEEIQEERISVVEMILVSNSQLMEPEDKLL